MPRKPSQVYELESVVIKKSLNILRGKEPPHKGSNLNLNPFGEIIAIKARGKDHPHLFSTQERD
jgi:hypothetical protein